MKIFEQTLELGAGASPIGLGPGSGSHGTGTPGLMTFCIP
jgi:hypothetical protein